MLEGLNNTGISHTTRTNVSTIEEGGGLTGTEGAGAEGSSRSKNEGSDCEFHL